MKPILNKKAQLTLSNPRDAKACKNWSHSLLKQVTVLKKNLASGGIQTGDPEVKVYYLS